MHSRQGLSCIQLYMYTSSSQSPASQRIPRRLQLFLVLDTFREMRPVMHTGPDCAWRDKENAHFSQLWPWWGWDYTALGLCPRCSAAGANLFGSAAHQQALSKRGQWKLLTATYSKHCIVQLQHLCQPAYHANITRVVHVSRSGWLDSQARCALMSRVCRSC